MRALLYRASFPVVTILSVFFAAGAWAGSFSTDFESGLPGGANVYGNAFVDTSGGVSNSGVLKLTTAANNQEGSLVLNDLDSGARIASFLVTFQMLVGGGTPVPADGFSFNFASDLPAAVFDEGGAGTGLTVTFDTFDNGTGDFPEGPELRVKYGGNLVYSRKLSNQIQTGSDYADVLIRLNSGGTLDVVYNGVVLVTNIFIATPFAGQFGFGARTGGDNENHFIDNLSITTAPLSRPYVKGTVTPAPTGAAPNTGIQVALQDNGGAVLTNGIQLLLNGARVVPAIVKSGGITTITYTPHGSFLNGSLNHIRLVYPDDSGAPDPGLLTADFAIAQAPLWSLAPGSRPYVTTDAATTPDQRSIAYYAPSNQVYLVNRSGPTTGLTVNVIDGGTGADLYQLNTSGISGGSIILLAIAVADDGSIYAANETTSPGTNPFKVYRWADANSNTTPVLVFSGDPGSSTMRWGDTLAVRGSGTNTQLIVDCQNAMISSVLAPADSSMTNFTATPYNHTYSGTTIGRSLQFGPGNTYYLKKRAALNNTTMLPLELIQLGSAPNTTVLSSVATFHPQVGPVTVDLSKNLAAGIFFSTNSADYDHLIVYDISNPSSPLQVGFYNFPTTHQANNNVIGEVVFGPDKIYAVDGNNGIICVPAFNPVPPVLSVLGKNGTSALSWTNAIPGFVPQATASLSPPAWTNLNLPVVVSNNQNYVTDPAPEGSRYYRLLTQ